MAGSRAARHPRSSGRTRGRSGAREVRLPAAVPVSPAPLRGLPFSVLSWEARGCTRTWQSSPTPRPIRTAAPGTGPRLRSGRMRKSPRSLSARPDGRRPAAGWPRRRRSWSARSRSPSTRCAGPSARWPRRRPACRPGRSARPRTAGHSGGRARMSRPAPGWTCCAGSSRFASGPGSDAPPLLLKAAKRLEPFSARPGARDLPERVYGSDVRRASGGCRRSCRGLPRRPGAAPPPYPPLLADLLLDGPGTAGHPGRAAAAPALRQAASAFASRRHLRRAKTSGGAGWPKPRLSSSGTRTAGTPLPPRQTRLARDVGALDQLPIDLASAGRDRSSGVATSARRPP